MNRLYISRSSYVVHGLWVVFTDNLWYRKCVVKEIDMFNVAKQEPLNRYGLTILAKVTNGINFLYMY